MKPRCLTWWPLEKLPNCAFIPEIHRGLSLPLTFVIVSAKKSLSSIVLQNRRYSAIRRQENLSKSYRYHK
jgi:hypothetical protein